MLNNSRPLFIAGGAIAAIAIVVVLLVVLLSGGGGGKKDKAAAAAPTPAPTAAAAPGAPSPSTAPEQALSKYVQATLSKGFVEDCTKAQPTTDTGKVCATFKQDRNNFRAYTLGLVGAQASQWAILQNQGGNWNVVYTPAITTDNAAVPGIPWPLATGVDLVIAGSSPCVNVREGPSINQKAVDCIADGTKIRLIAGPTPADNFQWWQVEGRTGWIVADFIRYPDAAQ